MKGDQEVASSSPSRKASEVLLAVPTSLGPAAARPQNLHKRAGSTGTTGDESATSSTTTDEEDVDEPDLTIKDHVTRKLFEGCGNVGGFGSYSDIATIADKVGHLCVTHLNSSDSSVYSDKCSPEDPPFEGGVKGGQDQAFARLQNELRDANRELKQRDQELGRLSRIRQDVEAELEDLTASLFQEAHNMVREANEKQAAAEKALKESQMKVDVLTAEVAALKTLVLTSTPSSPNPHLHPQIGAFKDEPGAAIFAKKHHRRSPSHFNLKYGREISPPDSPVKETVHIVGDLETKEGLEVDPSMHKEFLAWRQRPVLEKSDPFVRRIYSEDIDLCLRFNNGELSQKVGAAVESGSILVEAVRDKTKAMFPKKCALMEVPRLCFYRMNFGEDDNWHSISQICRNRIIAVCDFLNYLKYIERGLVKSSAHDVYWEIVRLRKNMALARLGLALS